MDIKRILLQESVQINGRWFLAKQNYCYEAYVHITEDPLCNECHNANLDNQDENGRYYMVLIDKVPYFIPESISIKTTEMINPLFVGQGSEYWGNKYQDQTTDYIKDVASEMRIDITKSYKAQHNGENVIRIMGGTKPSLWDDNMFLKNTNSKEGLCENEECCKPDTNPNTEEEFLRQ